MRPSIFHTHYTAHHCSTHLLTITPPTPTQAYITTTITTSLYTTNSESQCNRATSNLLWEDIHCHLQRSKAHFCCHRVLVLRRRRHHTPRLTSLTHPFTMRASSALSLCTVLLLSLSSLLLTSAQFERYTSGPIISHTFDTRPDFTVGGRTNFEWSLGRPPHSGLARFVNASRIDLLTYQDDNGKIMPRYLSPTLTLEFWAMYQTLGFWSRLLDCGNVAANGVAQDNIFISNMANDNGLPSNDLHAAFHIGNRSESTTAPGAIFPNSYQHIVATITRDTRYNITAHIELYVDGVLRARQDNAQVLNSNVERRDCWLGRSNWEWDADFRGYIDDFFYYDYPLSSEAVLAHFVLNRPPVYEQTFSTDPRLVLGYGAVGPNSRQASFFTYNWTNVDERDSSNITKYHDGHLVLAGDSYIDLAAGNDGSDSSSIGAAPIPVIGGVSGGDGTVAGGWSFEILFKADTVETWAKVFDCGNGKRRNNIILGYEGDTNRLRLEQIIGAAEEPWTLYPLDNVQTNTWYHIVVVFQRERWDRIDPRGNVTVYVNGMATATDSNAPMPLPVQRTTCYIGKSHWENDQYFDLLLDAFRLYDYALQAPDVSMLYLITHSPLPTDISTGEMDYSWHSAPIASYSFNRAPTAIEQELGSHYNYTRGTFSVTTFPHIGVATFNGQTDFVNLAQYDTDQGGLLPMVMGGSMSIEAWVRFQGGTQNWQRIIDLGGMGGLSSSNILLSAGSQIDELVFEVYSGIWGSGAHLLNGITNGEWMHIVAVAQQISMNDSYSGTAAVQRIYVNGQYLTNNIGSLPPKVARPSSWIARSNWYPNDWLFQGQMDAVHIYDRALDYEEVRAHYISYVPPFFELAFARDPIPWLGLNPNDPFNQPTSATLTHIALVYTHSPPTHGTHCNVLVVAIAVTPGKHTTPPIRSVALSTTTTATSCWSSTAGSTCPLPPARRPSAPPSLSHSSATQPRSAASPATRRPH